MAIYREDSGGTLHELGPIYREDSGGTLHELAKVYRETSGGVLREVYAKGMAAEDLFPDSDISDLRFSNDGGGSVLWNHIDEDPNDGDTTYIVSDEALDGASHTANFEVGLENSAEIHANSQTHRVHIVAKRVEGFGPAQGTVELTNVNLKQGGTAKGTSSPAQAISTVYVDYTFDLSVGTINDWSALSLQFVFDVDSVANGETAVRVTQAYLEIL